MVNRPISLAIVPDTKDESVDFFKTILTKGKVSLETLSLIVPETLTDDF
jgi:hypothetical protein